MNSPIDHNSNSPMMDADSGDDVYQELARLRALLTKKEKENTELHDSKHDLTAKLLHSEAMLEVVSKELERSNNYGDILKEELRITEELLSSRTSRRRATPPVVNIEDTDADEDSDYEEDGDDRNYCVDSIHLTKRKSNGISRIISLEEAFGSSCEIDNE